MMYPPAPGIPPGYEIPSMGRRIGSRFIEGAIGIGVIFPAYYMVLNYVIGFTTFIIYLLFWTAVTFGVQLMKGATVGQLVLGHRNVDLDTGLPAGGKTVAKYLLMSLGSQLSCGILLPLAVATAEKPWNKTWFDKALGVVVLRLTANAPTAFPAVEPSTYGSQPETYAPTDPYAQPEAYAQPEPYASPPMIPSWSSPPERVLPTNPIQVGDAVPSWAQPPSNSPEISPDVTAIVPMPHVPLAVGKLILDNGQEFRLNQSYVLGRDPVPQPGYDNAFRVAVADAARSLSKTHVLIGPDPAGVFVIDLHSTNGVAVTPPGGQARRLTPGERSLAPFGSTISYGQRNLEVQW